MATNQLLKTELLRWLLAAAVVAVVFQGMRYFFVFLLLWNWFPPVLVDPTAGLVAGFSVVAAGSLLAPRFKVIVALALAFVAATWVARHWNLNGVHVLFGGVAAVPLTAWLTHASGSRRRVRRAAAVGLSIAAVGAATVFAYRVDWPARPDPLPYPLRSEFDDSLSPAAVFFQYDLGGFIDHEYLWRIDLGPDDAARIFRALRLEPATEAPTNFWSVAPHYWPRRMPAGARCYKSALFSTDGRGHDGNHYFALHDVERQRLFVWWKSNF